MLLLVHTWPNLYNTEFVSEEVLAGTDIPGGGERGSNGTLSPSEGVLR